MTVNQNSIALSSDRGSFGIRMQHIIAGTIVQSLSPNIPIGFDFGDLI